MGVGTMEEEAHSRLWLELAVVVVAMVEVVE